MHIYALYLLHAQTSDYFLFERDSIMKKFLAMMMAVLMIVGACATLASCSGGKDAVKVIDIGLTEEEYAFAVAKGNSDLLAKLNSFLAEIKGNGTFDEIMNKYFGDGEPSAVKSAAEMKKDGSQLIVATNAAFEPFEYKEGENYYGIDMEIMDLFAKKLGKELYIYDMAFDAVCLAVSTEGGSYEETDDDGNVTGTTSVEGGICDIAAAGLTVNEKRKEILDFSEAYYDAAQMLIVAADDTTFDECETSEDVAKILAELGKDVKVGVQNGTTGKLYCEGDVDFEFEGYAFTTVGYDNGALAVQNIINGNVKYVVIDEGPAKAIVAKINEAN